MLERLIADGLAGRFPAEEVDILNWKEMLKRAQDLQLKLRKRLNQRAARSSAAPAMAEERQEESWAPIRWPRSRGSSSKRRGRGRGQGGTHALLPQAGAVDREARVFGPPEP